MLIILAFLFLIYSGRRIVLRNIGAITNEVNRLLDINFQPKSDVITNLKNGKLDIRKLGEIPGGNTNVYLRMEENQSTRPFNVCILCDESGSMQSCWDSTIIGFNEYVNGQKSADAGACWLTLNKFEGGRIRTVFENRDIREAPALDKKSYTPAGGTNLLDAIGHTIEQVNTILDSKKKKDRPGVIIVIMTDGEENQSTKYNNEMIKSMVAAAEKADWSFVFLGANIDSFGVFDCVI